MSNFWDYTLTNNFGSSIYLPQINFWAGNTGFNFNIWQFNSRPICLPAIFDFSYNSFNFPKFNFKLPVFQMPEINFNTTPEVTPKTQIEQKAKETDKTEDVTQTQELETTKTKTDKTQLKNKKFQIVKKEIIPGYYINQGNYSNTKGLKPYMKETLVKLDKKAKELGYTLVVVDGFRSHKAQAAAKKRKPKLCATPGKSAHEYGVAIDLALYKDGKKVSDIYKSVPEFGQYAQSLGLEWGATWKTKYEPWHFNYKNWQYLADVKNEYRRWNNLA